MSLAFTAITLSAGLLAGIALRAALAALRGGGRAGASAALAALAVVLVVTCMSGRTLLAGALGVSPAFTDWLVLFVAMAAGLAIAELLSRLGAAGRLPVDPTSGLRLPAWPLVLLTAVVAIVPAYAITAAAPAAPSCGDFDSARTAFAAQSAGHFPVQLRWSSAGACPPITATIAAQGVQGTRQGARYGHTFTAGGGSGELVDPGPSPRDPVFAVTCVVVYTLRLSDAAGHAITAQARADTCGG